MSNTHWSDLPLQLHSESEVGGAEKKKREEVRGQERRDAKTRNEQPQGKIQKAMKLKKKDGRNRWSGETHKGYMHVRDYVFWDWIII